MLEDKTQTRRAFLDELFPATPLLILDNVGHGAWANSQAMRDAGFDPLKPIQPQGGILLTGGYWTRNDHLLWQCAEREGQIADLIVLDKDITTISTDEIASTNVLSTLLGDRVVFDKNKLFN